jgi:drug/metabolite transporter (DMT)-like permease
MENNKNDYRLGVLAGIGSAITWGIDTVLMVIVLAMNPFLPENAVFLAPFITAFFHDAFSAVWTFIYLASKRQLGSLFKAMKTKSALVVALAALMGGPIGMTAYVLSVKYIGPSSSWSGWSIFSIERKDNQERLGWIIRCNFRYMYSWIFIK